MTRTYRSKEYNWYFDTQSGLFKRWGETLDDNPKYSPVGPEILDLEVSTICHGPGKPCSFCYKGNTQDGHYMSFERFKVLLERIPKNLTQIAFGIGDIDGNPDLEKIMTHTRKQGIIPNITINGYRMSNRWFGFLAETCGSVAVSRYDDDQCFDTVHELIDSGAKQVNIHQVFHETMAKDCQSLIKKAKYDKRLEGVHAILFLMLKPKGRARFVEPFRDLSVFKEVCDAAFELGILIGFDSCSAPSVLRTTPSESVSLIEDTIEPCESFLFSSYANVNGDFFPCSFCEGEPGWETGITVSKDTDFLKDIWFHPRMAEWRERVLNSSQGCDCNMKRLCRSCPMFDITPCKNNRTKLGYEDEDTQRICEQQFV